MDANATAKYLERRISDAVKEANAVRAEMGGELGKPLAKGSRATSSHTLDRLIDAEAVAVAWLEVYETAGGDLETVGHEAFLAAVRKEREDIQQYLRTSRHANTGTYGTLQLAQHNAATKVLAGTDVVELIDDPEREKAVEALAWLRKGWNGDNSERAIMAFDTLDNAGVYKSIEEN
jgi:hypothetical protein